MERVTEELMGRYLYGESLDGFNSHAVFVEYCLRPHLLDSEETLKSKMVKRKKLRKVVHLITILKTEEDTSFQTLFELLQLREHFTNPIYDSVSL